MARATWAALNRTVSFVALVVRVDVVQGDAAFVGEGVADRTGAAHTRRSDHRHLPGGGPHLGELLVGADPGVGDLAEVLVVDAAGDRMVPGDPTDDRRLDVVVSSVSSHIRPRGWARAPLIAPYWSPIRKTALRGGAVTTLMVRHSRAKAAAARASPGRAATPRSGTSSTSDVSWVRASRTGATACRRPGRHAAREQQRPAGSGTSRSPGTPGPAVPTRLFLDEFREVGRGGGPDPGGRRARSVRPGRPSSRSAGIRATGARSPRLVLR